MIRYVLGHENFSILSAGRTDSGVSCERGAFELFNIQPIDIEGIIEEMNINLPDDIRIINGQKVNNKFNIIQDVIGKEYRYYFTDGEKPHPFTAANIVWVHGSLDIDKMQEAAIVFVGEHDFRRFCTKGKNTDNYVRTVSLASISSADKIKGPSFPDSVYCFTVKGSGFLMHQVRLMMGALIEVGLGRLDIEDVQGALASQDNTPLTGKAPANGLVLHEVMFQEEKLL